MFIKFICCGVVAVAVPLQKNFKQQINYKYKIKDNFYGTDNHQFNNA